MQTVLSTYQPETEAEDALIAQALSILQQRLSRDTVLDSPQTVRNYLSLKLGRHEREIFLVLFLDSRHHVLSADELFLGTIDGATVHPREVVKAGLRYNAAAVILAHNHPSGISEASQADKRITERVKDALALIDIRVLDHFVIGNGEPFSFAERGLL